MHSGPLPGPLASTLTAVPLLRLKTFQPLARVDELHRTGRLVGDWTTVGGPLVVPRYQRMVQEMAAHGIDCHGHPPTWAWHGRVTLLDASMLLNAEHELSQGWATITFDAPEELVLLSDYAHWCDFLFEDTDWEPARFRTVEERALLDWAGLTCGVQATLPHVQGEWVDTIEPLPTHGWDELDLNTLV